MDLYQGLRNLVAVKKLRAPVVWYRHQDLRSSDVFLASYPRSGSTWMKFLLHEALSGEPTSFPAANEAVRYIGMHGAAPPLLPEHGRLIKTHEPFRKEYCKAIYMVRDARDVVLSEYQYRVMRHGYQKQFDDFFVQFMAGNVTGLGFWGDHVDSWLDAASAGAGSEILVVKFEDLRQRPVEVLGEVVTFLGVSREPASLAQVVENNTIDKMREKEDIARRNKKKTSLRVDMRRVNHGPVGGWRNTLTEEQARLVRDRASTAFRRLGYTDAG